MIENIEEFPAELQGPTIAQLLDRYIFSERKIQVRVARTGQVISSRASQESGVLESKGAGVDVAVWAAQDDVPLAACRHEIRAFEICGELSWLPDVNARSGAVGPQRWCEWIAGLNRQDAARPPAAQHGAECSTFEWLRHLINRIELPVVPQVKVRRASVQQPIGGVHAIDAGNLAIRPRLSLGFINKLRKGIGALERHPIAQVLVQPKLERVVPGVS